jgi:hypothetical protein
MAKEPQVKCRQCGKMIDRSSAYKIGKSSYYCDEECHQAMEDKNKKIFKPIKESPRRTYTDFIQSLYISHGIDKRELGSSFWAVISKQTDALIENYGTKYSSIQYTLWYMIEILGKNLISDEYDGTILNLVGYYLDDAKKYYFQCQEIKKMVKEFEFDDNVIVIKKSGNVGNRYREIDISKL